MMELKPCNILISNNFVRVLLLLSSYGPCFCTDEREKCSNISYSPYSMIKLKLFSKYPYFVAIDRFWRPPIIIYSTWSSESNPSPRIVNETAMSSCQLSWRCSSFRELRRYCRVFCLSQATLFTTNASGEDVE